MKNLGWWAAGLSLLGFGAFTVKKNFDRRPTAGDVAIVPIGKVVPATPPGASQAVLDAAFRAISTPLADGTVQINILSSADNTGRLQASMRNVVGITLPVFVFDKDIIRLSRNNVIVP